MEVQRVEIPVKKTDIVRTIQPGESIEVPENERQSWYNLARQSVPLGKWRTAKVDGKVYLNRVS
jgi:hypothetical protein